MSYEVELKFPLPDPEDVTLQLLALGAQRGATVRHRDLYWQHPCVDFRQSHEALRLRRCDDEILITYKGPLLDAQTKTRREIEIPVGRQPADFDRLRELLAALGFKEVRTVEKTRSLFHLVWDQRDLEIAVDSVAQLGTFLEIESLAEENDRNAARDAILRLAARLGLKDPERRSYLELVSEHDASQKDQSSGRPQ